MLILSIYSLQVEKLLDFLLKETHFTQTDITSCLRVFASNLEELKIRLNELTAIEFIPKRLYIICLDRKRYLKIIEQYCEGKNENRIWDQFMLIEKRLKERNI